MSALTNIKKSYGTRLKQIRGSLSYTQEKMASVLGLSRDSYVKRELGEIYPGYGVMRKLAVEYNISLDWLILGRGPMRLADREAEAKETEAAGEGAAGSVLLTPEKRQLLEHMAQVPLLNHELMAFYHRFKLQNKELFQPAGLQSPEEK